jgi:MFS family permease
MRRAAEIAPDPSARTDDAYARYVLAVLVVVYVFNFLDRQILSILAERIRADLGVSDAQLGFLYGTAFAIFYALFGIPLGRLADVWDRRRLIALGLAGWSAMTAVSGFARSFTQLAVARIGVGVGEASATPAAFSLLSDYFPAARRATALAVYSSGIYIGAGLGLGIGGLIVERWEAMWGAAPPLGLRGWQAAFLAVGLPGLLLALWVRSLREPARGAIDGLAPPAEAHPFRAFARELRAVLPPLTLVHLALEGAGARGLALNVTAGAAVAAGAALLVHLLGNPAQWIALGIGLYAAISWAQALRLRDRPTFAMVLGTPTLRFAAPGFALLAFVGYGIGFWTPPYFLRVHGVEEGQVGLLLGGTSAVAGWLGTTLGGLWADRWRRTSPAGRLYVGAASALLPLPLAVWLFTTERTALAYVLNFPVLVLVSMWIGPGASTVQELVLPRMRGTASAAYLLVVTFIGLALGPYVVGRLSVATGSLRTALLLGLTADLGAAALLLLAARHVARDEASRLARAHAAGEPMAPSRR